jgi:hypothetical protein
MWHTWERYDMNTKFWQEDLKGKDHLEDNGVDSRIIE